ncbi:MAG: DUF4249 domain-containing protein [Bacteroidetes bacterium]|nr:DUF4249 domain-containing protein [Bacteroidota bacterium]
MSDIILPSVFAIGFITGCEKDITVDLPQAESKIVIEGAIEQGEYPSVFVTRNAAYFDPVDSTTLANMVVRDAIVIVSNGTISDTLALGIDFFTVPFLKYYGTKFTGEVGKRYYLTVQVDGKSYTSGTTIPQPVELDSLVFRETEDAGVDNAGMMWLYFQDPDTLGNYYRYFTKTIGKDNIFVHPLASASDDKLANGQYIEFVCYRGWNPNLTEEQREQELEELGDIPWWAYVRGETVVMKFCTIDAAHYQFWRTIELQNSTDGNPFASPITVYTNIEGGALGVWGGYGVFLDTLVIE